MERGLEMEQKFPTGKVGDHSSSKQRGELRRYYKEQGRVTLVTREGPQLFSSKTCISQNKCFWKDLQLMLIVVTRK